MPCTRYMDLTLVTCYFDFRSFGLAVSDFRRQHRFSLRTIAVAAGVSIATISRVEKGRSASIEVLLPVAMVAGLCIENFVVVKALQD